MSTYPLRLPDHIMEQARAAAAEDGISINQMIASLVAEGLGHRRGLAMMRRRAARGDVDAALAILDQAPDVPPDEGDEPLDTQGTSPGLR
ncbi:hypothetical protein [Aurantimonas sp. 22II-16-19i]|uniref:hypothetical protein n=1 Tax=Aurantimonas sp. 22II-16-19i TaxID=1317114 RepID=UPI0009F7DC63|nr:hypothetical protein [Aurantimonas sp. 22II-16-19i]ORE98350.1 hypothetical protein ATO4_05182 [Aurantimonas sp. 22II-16-19i]